MPKRYIHGSILILILAAAYVCACGLPLIWDGAFQLSVTLIREHPFAYLTRFHTLILWWPTVWASRLTANPWILQAIYGLPFIIAPALSVAISWWIVRRDAPALVIWTLFGVCAGTLPGQVFIINDSIWQQTLFWPLFMAGLVPRITRPQAILLAVLAVFQFVHQIGVPLLFGGTVAATVLACIDRAQRAAFVRRAAIFAMLCLLAGAKIIITNHIPSLRDTYAEREFGWDVAVQRYRMGVEGWPVAGLTCIWFAALFVLLQARVRRAGVSRMLGGLAFFGILLAGGVWIFWASDGHRWYKALDYRRWILPLSFPFFTFAFVEAVLLAWRRRAVSQDLQDAGRSTEDRPKLVAGAPLRGPLACLLACTFAGVLGVQGAVWWHGLHRLLAEVNRSPEPVIALESIPWLANTPLDHWGTCDAITLLQGKAPRKLLVTSELLPRLSERPPTVPNQGWFYHAERHPPPPGPGGWFDFAAVLKEIARHTAARQQARLGHSTTEENHR